LIGNKWRKAQIERRKRIIDKFLINNNFAGRKIDFIHLNKKAETAP